MAQNYKVLLSPLTSSSIAHIVRSFAIAEILEKKGVEVKFTSCTNKKDFIEKEGYEVIKTYLPFNLMDPEDQSVNYMSDHKEELISWFKAEVDAAKEFEPDVVISSPGFFGAHVMHATGVPFVALLNGQYLPTSKGLMGISKSTDSLSDKITTNLLRPIFNKKFITQYLSEIADANKQLGLKHDYTDQTELYEGMHILIPGDEEFEPQRTTRENTEYVGPIFWDGFERNEEITDEFLEKYKNGKKLIYLTFGGSVFDIDAYNMIIDEFLKIDARKIIALGPNFKREDFPADSEELLIRNFVPGLRVSKHSNVVVNTGSQGAIMQALTHGVPVVAFPIGIDQAYFANRLEETGTGVNTNKISLLKFSDRENYVIKDMTVPMNVVEAVREVLDDEGYKQRAEAYADRLNKRNYEGAQSVINYIEANIL